eukprot:TRINITY_DN110235_c0_g1_i1.p1 TRINITY_DN110235_c0_g1~~TRINITY_DN110235_c0_g1_i1.p1  ORF type:complete len:228 (-),score=-17.39 TRINITY_DN110235_c0_g1_i1:74-757(-)
MLCQVSYPKYSNYEKIFGKFNFMQKLEQNIVQSINPTSTMCYMFVYCKNLPSSNIKQCSSQNLTPVNSLQLLIIIIILRNFQTNIFQCRVPQQQEFLQQDIRLNFQCFSRSPEFQGKFNCYTKIGLLSKHRTYKTLMKIIYQLTNFLQGFQSIYHKKHYNNYFKYNYNQIYTKFIIKLMNKYDYHVLFLTSTQEKMRPEKNCPYKMLYYCTYFKKTRQEEFKVKNQY